MRFNNQWGLGMIRIEGTFRPVGPIASLILTRSGCFALLLSSLFLLSPFGFLFFSLSASLPPLPSTHSKSALKGDKLACASLMTNPLGLSPTPRGWAQIAGTPRGEPHVCSPACKGRLAARWGVPVSRSWGKAERLPGGNGRFLPTRSSEPRVPAARLHPAPPCAPGKASRHTQAHAGPRAAPLGEQHPRPIAMATRGSFHSPPSRSPPPLLPALQPTGLSASRERAIKPKPVPPGSRGGRPTCSGGSGADLGRPVLFRPSRREKPDHAERAESAQAVHRPGLPAAPGPGAGEWRTPQVPLATLPSRVAPAGALGSLCLRPSLLRAFSFLSRSRQVAATPRCPTQCPARCPKTPPTCAPGVRAVLDDCSCCLVCARQRGESCSLLEPCEESRGLFCDRRADPSAGTGICMGNPVPALTALGSRPGLLSSPSPLP